MANKSMGEIISTLRKEKGMTQKQLADMLNITDKAVSKWERDIAWPDTQTIPKLAEKIGIGKKALYQKFKGITQFTLPEIRSICSVLNIQGERILEIFFNDKVA